MGRGGRQDDFRFRPINYTNYTSRCPGGIVGVWTAQEGTHSTDLAHLSPFPWTAPRNPEPLPGRTFPARNESRSPKRRCWSETRSSCPAGQGSPGAAARGWTYRVRMQDSESLLVEVPGWAAADSVQWPRCCRSSSPGCRRVSPGATQAPFPPRKS